MTALLAVQDLVAGYGPAPVLHGATLNVAPGEIVALLGSNGAGKSTFNNNVSGLYRAWAGRINFGDDDITASDPAQIVAKGLIQVPEGRRVFPNLSVRENLLLGAYRRGHANRARNFERVLDTFPRLRERLAQAAGTLSGGEQQMLAIGRGLMAEPRLLILDEPSLGLSPLLVEEMFALIERLNKDVGRGARTCQRPRIAQSLFGDVADAWIDTRRENRRQCRRAIACRPRRHRYLPRRSCDDARFGWSAPREADARTARCGRVGSGQDRARL